MNEVTLIGKLYENKGRFMRVVSKTQPYIKRKDAEGNPCPWKQDEVVCVCEWITNPLTDYQKRVQTVQKTVGHSPDFKATKPTNGAIGINGWPLVVFGNGNICLKLPNPSVIQSKYYNTNGEEISVDRVRPFLKSTENKRQTEAGIEKQEQVQYRTVGLANLLQLTVSGETFQIK